MITVLTFGGVFGPSLLVIAALRRWYAPLPWRTAFLLLAISVAFVGGGIVTRRVPFPLDDVVRGYPYRAYFGDVQSRNSLTNDVVKQILPWMQIARAQLRRGEAPLWNRFQFSGYPLLANGQSAPFSPLFLSTLFVPLPRQLVAMAGLKIFLALVFSYALLRRLNISEWAAIAGASMFAFSVFQTVYLYYPLTAVTCWMPAVAFAIHGSLHEGTRRWSLLLAGVTAAVLSGGHPESAFHVAIGALISLIGFMPRRRASERGTAVLRTILVALAGALIAAPAWLPVLQQVSLSGRAGAIASGSVVNGPFHHYAAFALLNPNAFGNPAHGNWNWINNYSMVAPTYFGLVLTALFCSAVVGAARRRPRELFLAAIVVALFLVALDWTLFGHLLNAIPPFKFAANDRLRFVALFFATIIAAREIDRIAEGERAGALTAAGVILAAAAALVYRKWHAPFDVRSIGGILAMAFVFFCVLLCRRRVVPVLIAVAVIGELFAFNYDFNRLVPEAYYRPNLPILQRLRELTSARPGRIVGFDWTFLPNAAAQYGLEDIRGSDPMVPAAYRKFLAGVAVPESLHDVPRIQNVDSPALDFLNVRYLLTDPDFGGSARWQLVYAGRDGRIFESRTVLPRFFSANATTNDRSNASGTKLTVNVSAAAPAFIASSQAFTPGWTLDVNGKRTSITPVNGAFIGFRVPAGSSVVRLRYRPFSFWFGCVLSLLTIIALTASTALPVSRRAGPRRAAAR